MEKYVEAIRKSGLSIYDHIDVDNSTLWIPSSELENILNKALCGFSLEGLALRTRSKVIKERICETLGYPIPNSFKKTKPRFPGQLFDTYVQKANNLQVWNEELSPNRRYVIIRLSAESIVKKVKVVTGKMLAILDTTGTLTQKYQARLLPAQMREELISKEDTILLRPLVREGFDVSAISPIKNPRVGELLPIQEIFEKLRGLVGNSFSNRGFDQERNRGAELHRIVCKALGYKNYRDDGQFPDVRHQLLEVKLQTSSTIDLGLVCPDSTENLDVPQIEGQQIRHCDIRYALFYAETNGKDVTLTHFFLSTGESFFSRFPKFQGKVLNKKLQIPLPRDFFED